MEVRISLSISKVMSRALVSMPYKMGDSMWALPAAKEIAKIYGPVAFVLGSYCNPLVLLYEY